MHAWRGKFAVEEAEEAYQLRREGGLDTSITTMDAVLARALGHQRSESARPYTANYEASEVSRRRAARDSERQSDKRRVRELEAELERLLHSKHV